MVAAAHVFLSILNAVIHAAGTLSVPPLTS